MYRSLHSYQERNIRNFLVKSVSVNRSSDVPPALLPH